MYTELGRSDYVLITALALMFSVMTSYTRARAESLIEKCKVGFMERPERIVLFMIGAFTNRMAGVLWVILVLSVITVVDRIYFTWRELKTGPVELHPGVRMTFRRVLALPALAVWHALFWTFDRTSWQYDLMVIRHPRVRLGDAARLARRPRGARPWRLRACPRRNQLMGSCPELAGH